MNSLEMKERDFQNANQGQPQLFSEASGPPTAQGRLQAMPVGDKAVIVDFDGGSLSSDAGLLLLKEVDEQIGLTASAAAALVDERDDRYTRHSMTELLRQRVFQIAAGYEDGNDSDRLRKDPILKMSAGRLPETGDDLASQPTISRFENAPSRSQLYRMAEVLFEQFTASYAEAPRAIVLDFDDTDTRTYGDQQLTLFNAFYGGYSYMPLHVYEGLSGRLITTLLKPTRLKGAMVRTILRRVARRLREHWPKTRILFRGDSHFASPEVMAYIEETPGVHFVVGLRTNARLKRLAGPVLERARRLWERSEKPKVTLFDSFGYRAGSWKRAYRVIVKVEISAEGANVRFIVTDIEETSGVRLYKEIYCNRARAEGYIKEHKCHLRSDRASCHRFEANQFRLLLHSLAYALYETYRREVLRGTKWARATIDTLRLYLVKIGARIRELKTRIKVELPTACPLQPLLRRNLLMMAQLRRPG